MLAACLPAEYLSARRPRNTRLDDSRAKYPIRVSYGGILRIGCATQKGFLLARKRWRRQREIPFVTALTQSADIVVLNRFHCQDVVAVDRSSDVCKAKGISVRNLREIAEYSSRIGGFDDEVAVCSISICGNGFFGRFVRWINVGSIDVPRICRTEIKNVEISTHTAATTTITSNARRTKRVLRE